MTYSGNEADMVGLLRELEDSDKLAFEGLGEKDGVP